MTNANVPFVTKVFTDLLVGYEINKDGPDKVVANAELTVSIATAVVNAAGDPAGAVVAIEAALAASTTDPAKQAALETVIAFIGTKVAALNGLLAGSLTATLIAQGFLSAAQEAILVANKYLPATAK